MMLFSREMFLKCHHHISFIPDSCSSGTDEPPTLDMSKIPQQLQIPYEQLQIHRKLGQVSIFCQTNQHLMLAE